MPESKHSNVPQGDATWHLSHWVRDSWEKMYEDCLAAKKSIEFEQYILENDSVGQRFLELFAAKAKSGVKIFLICDTFGSASLRTSPFIHEIRNAGGIIHFYRPFTFWRLFAPWNWFPRTHVKTMLIDSRIAHTGGVCVAERMREWRDTHLRFTGTSVSQVRKVFDEMEHKIQSKGTADVVEPVGIIDFVYVMNRPRKSRFTVYRELLKAITEAHSYIYISTAFFVPNRRFLQALRQAVRRGVQVIVLVPEKSDVILADWICLSYTPQFLRSGFRIFHYSTTVLHSKTAIIDDRWGTVGSTNFDLLSFFHNREANVIIRSSGPIAELKRQFGEDLKVSTELTRERWLEIPMYKKVCGYLGRVLRLFF